MPSSAYRRDSLARALRTAALAFAADIETQLDRASRRHHSGIHRARKASVRLRSLLCLLQAAPPLQQGIRNIARALSSLRNAQAAIAMARRVARPAADPDVREAWQSAIGSLEADRDRLLEARLRADPALSSLCRRFARLRAALENREWQMVEPARIKAALARSIHRARRARRRARADFSQATRHRLRRRMRRLLLQIDLLQTIADDREDSHAAMQARELIERASKHHRRRRHLVETLGDERDLRLLRRALEARRHPGPTDLLLAAIDKRLSKAIEASNRLIE